MPIVRILLVLLAFASPAFAQDGIHELNAARDAAKAFKAYIDGVAKKGQRPDLTRPDVAAMLGHIYDVDAFALLPPPEASDMNWLPDWIDAANQSHKLFIFYGAKPGPQPDLVAAGRNMIEYGDQYATAVSFMIRGLAREAVASQMFWNELPPEHRTRIREEGFAGLRRNSALYILSTVCAAIQGASKPENARLVAASLRDTREVWASYLLPEDRTRVIAELADLPKWAPDEVARADLGKFTAALQVVN
ncbi:MULTISPECIES: hypothetical protein [unclassified Bradyrhizobium]|uniref:hypothetical protein n=1 Tax=unclassified Bradyrhizobium TaxID=2631580 RepID=UPI002305EED9|nr:MULTISPECIES: hypothetical protein [unclassified Bradyrhizobium]MDA9412707.1 hypothetical protein [Bradyrhizobium sp. CCBAU 45384]MDA9443155.1 hypothetical protein [Bradyrhizobium sp. CCBAU 51745]